MKYKINNFHNSTSQQSAKLRRSIFVSVISLLCLFSAYFFAGDLGVEPVYAGSTLTPTSPPTNTPVPTATSLPPTSTATVPSPADTEVPTNTPQPPAPTSTPRPSSGGQSNPPPTEVPTIVPTATNLPVQEIPELGVSGNFNFFFITSLGIMLGLMWLGATVNKVAKNG